MSMSPPCLSKQNIHSFSSPEEGDYNTILITQKYSIDKNEPIISSILVISADAESPSYLQILSVVKLFSVPSNQNAL